MRWSELKLQCRRRGNTEDMDVADVKLVPLEDETVVLLLQYDRERRSKPWGFRLRRNALPSLIRQAGELLESK